MNTHVVLTIDVEGELPVERECFTDFAKARTTADAYIENGKYAAGVKRLFQRKPVLDWCYLNCTKHGPTEPEFARPRRRKLDPGEPLPMSGNPVSDGAKQ